MYLDVAERKLPHKTRSTSEMSTFQTLVSHHLQSASNPFQVCRATLGKSHIGMTPSA